MRAMRCRHLLWTLPAALAAGILGCEQARPTQPSGAATKLAFTGQPTNVAAAQPITPAVQVAVQDAVGNRVPGATDAVTVALGLNPSGGTLGGTVTVKAAQGVTTFADLRIDRPGSGYLPASGAGLSGATSTAFAVTLTFAAVTASGLHTCGFTIVTGAAYCWGANGSGQLGDGTMTNRSSPVLVQAPAGVSFAAVTGGDLHTCGLATGLSAAAYCWGGNGSGQLGDGTTTTNRLTPVLVLAPAGVSFAAVTGGAAHTRGLTTGLSAAAYCWGGNGSGQLGDGTKTNQLTPVLVQAPAGVSFAAAAAGGAHTSGGTGGGAADCWGANGRGQLGDGTTTTIRLTPVLLQAPAGVTFAAVTRAPAHTRGVTAAAAAYCWGRNVEGQLGDGTTTDRLTPVR